MVRAAGKEDDLYALAAQGGQDQPSKDGIPLQPIFLGPESGQVDEGFETRVKPPSKRVSPKEASASKDDAPRKGPGRPRGTSADRSAAEIGEALQQKFDEFFAVVSLGLPVTGTYGVENSDKAVKALLAIGKRRPGVMKVLMRVADGADGIDIGRYVLGIAVAIQVDMGRVPGDMILARATGVTEVIEKYFVDDGSQSANPSVTEQVTHARFQPVS